MTPAMFMVSALVFPISKNTACRQQKVLHLLRWLLHRQCRRGARSPSAGWACCGSWRTSDGAYQVQSESRKRIGKHEVWIYFHSSIPQQLSELQRHCMLRKSSLVSTTSRWQQTIANKEVGAALTKGDGETQETGWRDIVKTLQGVHLQSLAVDEHLHKAKSGSLHGTVLEMGMS